MRQEYEDLINRPIIIYGAGSMARTILPYLKHNPEFEPVGIAVTDDGSGEYLGLEIRPITAWKKECGNAVVLIATSRKYHREIESTCSELGFSKVVPLTPKLKDSLVLAYYRQDYEKKGISLEDELLKIGSVTYINPLKQQLPNAVNLLTQIGDFVFPSLFQDYRMVVEGPYDWRILALKPGEVVIDCGANLGAFSAYAAAKGCLCYAFEPTPELLPNLKELSALNGGRIIPVAAAAADRSGETTFYIDSYSCGGSSLLRRAPDMSEITVSETTLDDFAEKMALTRIDFIKADIEGAERKMLSGARRVLEKFSPALSLCTYHLPDDREVLTKMILEANPNYQIEHQWQKLYAYVKKEG